MKNLKPALLVIIVVLISLFTQSCSPTRQAIRAPIREEGSEYLLSKLKERELKFDWFTAKFSAEYQNKDTKTSFSGQIRIRKDSMIWLSLTPMLGIEAIRLMISQDSVKMINRLNNTYLVGDYNFINRFLNTNIDFDLLQAFLLGNDLQFYENGKFRASVDKGEYRLSTMERQKLKKFVRNSQENLKVFIQNIWLDPQTFKISHADVKEIGRENTKLEASYGSFEEVEGQVFAKEMNYTIWAENTLRVQATFTRIGINVHQQFPFKIPGSYSRIQ